MNDLNTRMLSATFRMAQIEEDIIHHYRDPNYQIQDLCRRLHWSRTTVYRIIAQYKRQSFTRLLEDTRIEQAGYLLRHSDRHISEVAYAVGYQDPSYFTKRFKSRMGLTPSEYRRKNRTPKAAIISMQAYLRQNG